LDTDDPSSLLPFENIAGVFLRDLRVLRETRTALQAYTLRGE
jgi:hypothetical protein